MSKNRQKIRNPAEEAAVAQEYEVRQLKEDASLLKKCPEDFRDIAVDSPMWTAFGRITGRAEEMHNWTKAGTILVAPLTQQEERYFQGERVATTGIPKTWIELVSLISYADANEYTHIYMPHWPAGLVLQLNKLLSILGCNERFIAKLSFRPWP